MLTINETANREILKAKRALAKAIDILVNTPEYESNYSIFHACTVNEVKRMVDAVNLLNN